MRAGGLEMSHNGVRRGVGMKGCRVMNTKEGIKSSGQGRTWSNEVNARADKCDWAGMHDPGHATVTKIGTSTNE